MASISEPHFSGLNWNPHPRSTPDWYLSSLSTTFRGWTQTRGSTPIDGFHLWTSLFGVELEPTSWFNPVLVPFMSEHNFSGVELRPEVQPPIDGFHLWTSLFGVELEPTSWLNPLLVPFMSEHNFSGLNSDTRFNPHWWLSSLNLTFRGWTGTHILVQPPTGTLSISEHNFSGLNSDPLMAFHLWTSLIGIEPIAHSTRYSTGTHILVQPPADTFHLWAQLFGVELRPEVQPPIDGFHLWTSLFGVELEPTSWFNPVLVPFMSEHNFSGLNSDPRFNPPLMAFISEPHFSGLNWNPHPGTFHLWAQLFGVELRHEVQPPLMAFISEPHFFGVEPMPIPINMAYGDSWHQSICSPRNKPWEYKPKPNRFLVHSHCANRNEPKRTKGLLLICQTDSHDLLSQGMLFHGCVRDLIWGTYMSLWGGLFATQEMRKVAVVALVY